MNGPSLRVSQAAVVLIQKWDSGESAYLCQWSDSWQALHFIGGHREVGETFRDCAIREVQEELGLDPAEFEVPTEPSARLDYVAFSESAGVPTQYVMDVFPSSVVSSSLTRVAARPENRWVDAAAIRAGRTQDGCRISSTVGLILGKLGLLNNPAE